MRLLGGAVLAADRGDVADPAVALCDHRRQHRLGDQERALGVDVHHAVPVRLGERLDGGGDQDAGIVDERVDRAEFRDRARHHRLDLRLHRHVGMHRDRAPPAPPRLGHDLVEDVGLAGDVVEGKVEAPVGEAERDGAADAAARAGDECDPSVAVHRGLLVQASAPFSAG